MLKRKPIKTKLCQNWVEQLNIQLYALLEIQLNALFRNRSFVTQTLQDPLSST
jgi:hypothetical protein